MVLGQADNFFAKSPISDNLEEECPSFAVL